MKRYKPIDLFLQITVAVIILLGLVMPGEIAASNYFILFGLIQLISLLIHIAAGPQLWKENKLRKIHLIGTVIVIALVVFAFFQDSFTERSGDKDDKYIMPGLAILIYTMIPVIILMIFYMFISWMEWRNLKKQNDESR